MYVCMFQVARRVCLYESVSQACVCMSQVAKRVCILILDSPKPLKYINIFDPSHSLILVRQSLQSMDTFSQNEIKP